MAAAARSQDMIQQLLIAEKQAEDLIASAKKGRVTKLRQAKEKAEEELKDFKNKEKAKFDTLVGSKANEDPSKALAKASAQEISMVQADYTANKDKALNSISAQIFDVPLGLSE